LRTWGYRASSRAARSFKQSPYWLDETSNGRITSQYECLCDGRAKIMHRRRREEVLDMRLWGERTKYCVCRLTTDVRINQRQGAFGQNVLTIITSPNRVKPFLNICHWTRLFNARRTHLLRSSNPHKTIPMNYSNFRIIPAKLSRSAKQHPSNSAHLMRRFVRGLSI
jgi:hypothetical protein